MNDSLRKQPARARAYFGPLWPSLGDVCLCTCCRMPTRVVDLDARRRCRFSTQNEEQS